MNRMSRNEEAEVIRRKYSALAEFMDERTKRRWAGAEARAIGYGGISQVSRATGLSRTTVKAGIDDLRFRKPRKGIRRRGGGRKPLLYHDTGLLETLESLVDPTTRGDPESLLRWTCKSKSNLAEALRRSGHSVSASTVGRLLHNMGYSLQAMRKTKEGKCHPDRDAQFLHINSTAARFQSQRQPVISVDTKKKELIGSFKNGGREWQPSGEPEPANTHDFPSMADGKAIPYGVYDQKRNEGWVNVGVDHDTPSFAVHSVRQWWRTMGKESYPKATRLLITADAGGSNSYRSRLWKFEVQRLADETGLAITVCHFPPGTSKWNKIEHRLFCHITQNWRGRPLASYETVVKLIGSTSTKKGLRVKARLDRKKYPTGIRISDEEIDELNLTRAEFHGDWNYTLRPRIP